MFGLFRSRRSVYRITNVEKSTKFWNNSLGSSLNVSYNILNKFMFIKNEFFLFDIQRKCKIWPDLSLNLTLVCVFVLSVCAHVVCRWLCLLASRTLTGVCVGLSRLQVRALHTRSSSTTHRLYESNLNSTEQHCKHGSNTCDYHSSICWRGDNPKHW